jgi:hypothetical protein
LDGADLHRGQLPAQRATPAGGPASLPRGEPDGRAVRPLGSADENGGQRRHNPEWH